MGLWEGAACQQSRIIMYLQEKRAGQHQGATRPGGGGGSQLVGAGGRLVHAVSLLQQLEELLHGDAGVG